jgi:PTS system fructose-specific IIC component
MAKSNKDLFVVGVTTCPTGVAHTFMSAKALEKELDSRGIKHKIEKQGQMTKDKLTQAEIDKADFVIFAAGKGVDERERFNGKIVYETQVVSPIKDPKGTVDKILKHTKVYGSGKNITKSKVKGEKEEKKAFNQGPIRHLLTGISYMIPFIAMAGIVLGFTTAFGFGMMPDGVGG